MNRETIPNDTLAKLLAKMPQDEHTANLVAELFSRYEAKGIAHRFALHLFRSPQENPTGLLIGLAGTTAVFWRSSAGHFWMELDQIVFLHEAAALSGTHSPFIGKPKVGTCYRFHKGELRIVATPFMPCNALQQYQDTVRILEGQTGTAADDDVGEPHAQKFKPIEDGFTLLGEVKL